MKVNSHGGHNKYTPGAYGSLDERVEDRKVNSRFIKYLRAEGHTVYDLSLIHISEPTRH